MKRTALLTAIVIALSVSNLTGCDDKKSDDESTPSAKAQPAQSAPASSEKPKSPTEVKPAAAPQPELDAQAVEDAKMNVYIKCFNELQLPVSRSLSRYASWLQDFKKGPSGKEQIIYGIYGITKKHISDCETEMKHVITLTPKLDPIDSVAGNYIDTAMSLGNTINEMDEYYTQENYKDDAFAKGKALHQVLLKNISAFEPVAEQYHAAIIEINDRRQRVELKRIEASEGKTFNYYALATMVSAKQINKVIAEENFDAPAVIKKVAELEDMVALLKQADKGDQHFPYVNAVGDFQLAAKKYVRRVRDKVAYTEDEKEELQDPLSAWMVEDSYPAVLKHYNEMVNNYNLLH